MIQIQYKTQRLSMRFFMLMFVLFFVQVGFGLLIALQHYDPSLLAGKLNFNIARAEHQPPAVPRQHRRSGGLPGPGG